MVTDSNVSLPADIELGSRIECDEHYGTIRYIGTVNGHTNTWLGIDWDDPTRGKHDGTVAGEVYFTASHPTSGSFVRPGKIQFGRDAIMSITSRYGKKETPSEANVNQLQLLDLQREIKAPFLEMVGFDKINERQSNFNDLKVVSLRLQFVNGPGAAGGLQKLCPNIVELDLSKNLLSKWFDIFDICEQLPNLHLINLSENLLEFPPYTECITYTQITSLICGQMKLTWNDVLRLASIFPRLEEFRVQYNLITCMERTTTCDFPSLKILDLEGNRIESWSEINKLGNVRPLEQLILTNTGIRNVTLPSCVFDEKLYNFMNLKQIVLSENLIDNWQSISQLNKLKNLEHLRFLKNPLLYTEKPATCTQYIIARVEKLTILNGTEIKSDERNGAEYDYVKKFALEWFKVSKDNKLKHAFLETHPRYLELIDKHGLPEESELVFKTLLIKTSLITVHIKYEDIVVPKKLPLTMTVQKLLILIQKLFRLSEKPKLHCLGNAQSEMLVVMDDEFKEIGYYALRNGDNIIVSES